MIRVLLDEDLDVRLRLHLGPRFHVETVSYRRWTGKKNGALLALAETDFDVLVTADSNLLFQQNLSKYNVGVVVRRPESKTLQHLIDLLPDAVRAIENATPGQVVEVHIPNV
jgi:hypothetical protein